MNIYTSMHGIAKIKDNNAISDKNKVSHSLTSGGTFVVYIVHPMCDGLCTQCQCKRIINNHGPRREKYCLQMLRPGNSTPGAVC